jgi:hypothetical protein
MGLGTFVLRIVALSACAIFAALPAAAQKNDKSKLGNFPIASLFFETDTRGAQFGVVDSRMEETATATVFFGIIGGAINSGINADEDAKKAAPFVEAASKIQFAPIMDERISATLAAKSYVLAEGEKAASHALKIEIKEWGLTRTAFDDPRLTPFIRLHAVMKGGKKVVWDTYLKDSAGRSGLLPEFTSEILVQEIEALAAKMGERIAYEIIYR